MSIIRSQNKEISFGPGLPTLRIGERINPTGKPEIQKNILAGKLDWLEGLAREQEAAGASVIGVNIGMPGIDESSLLVQAVEILEKISDLPLYIDSSLQNALLSAIKVYPHKALV